MKPLSSHEWTLYEFEFPGIMPWDKKFHELVESLNEKYKIKLLTETDQCANILIYEQDGSRYFETHQFAEEIKKRSAEKGLESKFRGRYTFNLHISTNVDL